MKVRVQVVIEADDDEDDVPWSVARDVAQIDRDALSIDTLGLHLDQAKHLLQQVQAVLIDEQVRSSLAEGVACPRLWPTTSSQGHQDNCHPHAVRHLASEQPALASMSLPTAD